LFFSGRVEEGHDYWTTMKVFSPQKFSEPEKGGFLEGLISRKYSFSGEIRAGFIRKIHP
jgi:hypothetical protein